LRGDRVDGARDWRLNRLMGSPVWFGQDLGGDADGKSGAAFEALWTDLRGGEPEEPAHLQVLGRDVVIERTAGSLARATFDELCARPLGPQDYLAIAGRFHTLFLDAVPILTPDRRQEAKRMVTLIDALYEAGTRLVVLRRGRTRGPLSGRRRRLRVRTHGLASARDVERVVAGEGGTPLSARSTQLRRNGC
jgi:predicted ATPase